MTTLPPCYGIIPARYQSSRFPGKPLADILGKPMFYRVYERAASCPFLKNVWLATDDVRIYSAAEKLGVPVVMTDPEHHSGSDRIMEAAEKLGFEDESVVVNIQGDEPELDREIITRLVEPFSNPEINVTTPARIIDSLQAANPDRVKVVRSSRGYALYFSRSKIPHIRDDSDAPVHYLLHIGLYAYRLSVLKAFTSMEPSPLEEIEKLEQLRLLEAGINIYVILTDYRGFGVDRPEDLIKVIEHMKND